jgi:small subunit ribosomal protein S1
MKHNEDDPWETAKNEYPVGKEVQAKILRMLDRGVVAEMPNGLEAFIPSSKLTTETIKHPSEAFKPDDTVPAIVTECDPAGRKMTLSVVDYFKNKEDAEWKGYLEAHKPRPSTLGDVLNLEGDKE